MSVELRSTDLGPSELGTQLDATVSDGQSGTTSASFRGDVSATNEEAQDDNGDFGQSPARGQASSRGDSRVGAAFHAGEGVSKGGLAEPV